MFVSYYTKKQLKKLMCAQLHFHDPRVLGKPHYSRTTTFAIRVISKRYLIDKFYGSTFFENRSSVCFLFLCDQNRTNGEAFTNYIALTPGKQTFFVVFCLKKKDRKMRFHKAMWLKIAVRAQSVFF